MKLISGRKAPLHPQKVTVWCGFHAGGVIGPYFFVDENDCHVTVNRERYRAVLDDYLWPELDELCGFNKTVPLATQHASQ